MGFWATFQYGFCLYFLESEFQILVHTEGMRRVFGLVMGFLRGGPWPCQTAWGLGSWLQLPMTQKIQGNR